MIRVDDVVNELATIAHVYPHFSGTLTKAMDEIVKLREATRKSEDVLLDEKCPLHDVPFVLKRRVEYFCEKCGE